MILMTACQQKKSAAEEKFLPSQTLLNVAYGKDPLQKMDVYLPAGRSTVVTRAIVLIHGGGWNSGNKSDFASYIDTFKKRLPDYAIFNLNYRLVNGSNLFPTQEQDIKLAMDFITAHATEYQFDKDQMALMGASAGAHLALLQAYKYNEPKIKAVIDYFGPTDLLTMYNHPWHPLAPLALHIITGTSPQENEELYRQSSPVTFVTSHSTPTLILHGADDQVVNVSQSKILDEKLKKAGVVHKMVIYPGERHGWWHGGVLTNSIDHIVQFLKENMS